MKKNYSLLIASLFFSTFAMAQVVVDAELRPRFEYRHGYKDLFSDAADAATFVSQRTRINGLYSDEKLTVYLSVQDVRVWGDVPQSNLKDKNGVSIHQAWGEIKFTPEFSAKLGRQVLSYDDQRILGGVDWAQQGRSHDMALLKYSKNGYSAHLGAAFNQDEEKVVGHTLNTNTYKSMQLLWLNKSWDNFKASVLFLNNGMQYIDALDEKDNKTRYSQTFGTNLLFSENGLHLAANLYYQTGKDVKNNSLNAYLVGLEAGYQVTPGWNLQLGAELQSGNDYGAPSNGKNKAFTPLYGTNHKFNGLMDYFYAGNHLNNVGLMDIYLGSTIQTGGRSNLGIRVHNFTAAADMIGDKSKQLGVEADLTFNYNFTKNINLQAGYSHMFASSGMERLKGNIDDKTNNWAWVMVTLKPTFFNNTNK